MSWVGLLHLFLMIVALVIGIAIFAWPKGTPKHKRFGRIFLVAMVVSNLAVLTIYRDAEQLGIFHYLALISLASLAVAILLVRLPNPNLGRRIAHGHVMLWSYGGVVAAGIGQGAAYLGVPPWPPIIACFGAVGLIAMRANFHAMLKRT